MKSSPHDAEDVPVPGIRQHLLLYDDLSSVERSETDVYLRSHPEGWAVVEEGRRIRRLVSDGLLDRHDEDLPLFVAVLGTGRDALPPHIDRIRRRIMTAAADDPAVVSEFAEYGERLKLIVEALPSAAEHFAELRGRAIDKNTQRSMRERLKSARPHLRAAVRRAYATTKSAVDPKRLAAAAILIATLFGATWIVSDASQPLNVRVAALENLPDEIDALTLRDGDGGVDEIVSLYSSALAAIRDSRTTTFGLFPRFDISGLAEADLALGAIIGNEPASSAISLEARYVRAKLHVHRNQIDSAVRDLEIVVAQQGPSARDAESLLKTLSKRARVEGR